MSNSNFTIQEQLRGFDLTFKTTYDLFSYKKIDSGTRILVDALEIPAGANCLDLGCGYGPVGVVMGKLNPYGRVFFVDRDFVAVEYSQINCLENGVKNFEARLSNGFDNLKDHSFDVVASNLPSHIAKESLEKMIVDTKKHLRPGGKFFVVCVSRLKPYIQRELTKVFPDVEIGKHNREYVVLIAK